MAPVFMSVAPEKLIADAPPHLREHVANFSLQGFAIIRQSIPEDAISRALSEFVAFTALNSEICNRNRSSDGRLRRIVNLHLALSGVAQLFTENTLSLELQDYLFGGDTCVYTSLYFEAGSEQPIHRDTPYFSTVPEYSYFGMWVALEDANEHNGALTVIPGAHLLPELDRESIALRVFSSVDDIDPFSPHLWEEYQQAVLQQCTEQGLAPTTVSMRKGDTLIWHPQLPHGGTGIISAGSTRHSVVFHTTPYGVPVYKQDAFFNPRAIRSDKSPWVYSGGDKHRFALTSTGISFAHKEKLEIEDIRRSL